MMLTENSTVKLINFDDIQTFPVIKGYGKKPGRPVLCKVILRRNPSAADSISIS